MARTLGDVASRLLFENDRVGVWEMNLACDDRVTYAAFHACSSQLAQALERLGVGRGARVAVMAPLAHAPRVARKERLEEMALDDSCFIEKKKRFPNIDFDSGVILSAIVKAGRALSGPRPRPGCLSGRRRIPAVAGD